MVRYSGKTIYDDAANKVDSSSYSTVIISNMEHEIHEGNAFHFAAVDTSMGDGDTLSVSFTIPDQEKQVHLTFWWESKAGGHISIYEGLTAITGGAVLTPKNMNANSSNVTSLTETFMNPTGITGGTLKGSIYAFGSRTATASATHDEEMVMKRDTKYLFELTADGATNAGYLHIDWYEHTPEG